MHASYRWHLCDKTDGATDMSAPKDITDVETGALWLCPYRVQGERADTPSVSIERFLVLKADPGQLCTPYACAYFCKSS